MLIFLASLIIIIGYLDYSARKSRVDAVLVKSRFRLFAARDRLRSLAIDEKIAHDKWFDYFDTTLTKMIDLLPTLTVWQIILMIIHYRNDILSEKWHAELDGFLSQNEEYRAIFREYAHAVGDCLLGRHWVLAFGVMTVGKIAMNMSQVKRDAAALVATAPETSTFLTYCEN